MPAYNAAQHIDRSIGSILIQDLKDLELIIIDDGSTDNTLERAKSFNDDRIKVFSIVHSGVSAARNKGLKKSRGEYFCFLDADDELPPSSISSRAALLDSDLSLEFADGNVLQIDEESGTLLDTFVPRFKGKVIDELMRFHSSCFAGNTWMIRRSDQKTYHFREDISHAEDLHFYLSIAGDGNYTYTDEVVLHYYRHPSSAMNDIRGMADGLFSYLKFVQTMEQYDLSIMIELKYRLIRAVCGSYYKEGRIIEASKAFFKFFLA